MTILNLQLFEWRPDTEVINENEQSLVKCKQDGPMLQKLVLWNAQVGWFVKTDVFRGPGLSNGTYVSELALGSTVRRNGRTANLFGFSNFYVRFRKYDTRWWFLMQELNITPCVLKRFSRIKNIADKIINYTIICSVIHPPYSLVCRTWGQKASKISFPDVRWPSEL